MPDIIHLLPDKIANRIAAGEVVQRPASVVKELMENALDAKAQRIKLSIRNAGKTMIQVTDNGIGMTETDARMCFERHATSKIRNVEDLLAIRTMGFRGEALASIASVAQVELQTKTHDTHIGTKLIIEGSHINTLEACACIDGTSLTVRNLFFNTPARQKFLKSDSVEFRHIQDEFLRIALAHPELYFSLVHNDKEIFNFPVSGKKQRIITALGRNLEDKLIRLEEDTDLVKISGFIASPAAAKKRRGDQYFFINDRFFKSPYLHHAVRAAYGDLLSPESHPAYVIFLDIDPARVDVNVHPSKQEVKFEDERILYNYLQVTCKHAIGNSQSIPSLDFDRRGTADFDQNTGGTWRPEPLTQREQNNQSNWQELYNRDSSDSPTLPSSMSNEGQTDPLFSSTEFLTAFSMHKNYLCVSIRDGVIFMDRQAAEGKLLYEKFVASFKEELQIPRQKEIFPSTIHLSPADSQALLDIIDIINSFGFELSSFGENTFINHAVPALGVEDISLDRLLQEMLEAYRQDRPSQTERSQYFARILARRMVSNKRKRLSNTEILQLYDRLHECELGSLEPFGRKCLIHLSTDELKQLFTS